MAQAEYRDSCHPDWDRPSRSSAGIAYVVNWKADIESRVHILEERGSPHLAQINNRLTVTEKETTANKERIDRVVEIMLRELPVKREQLKP